MPKAPPHFCHIPVVAYIVSHGKGCKADTESDRRTVQQEMMGKVQKKDKLAEVEERKEKQISTLILHTIQMSTSTQKVRKKANALLLCF